MRPRYEQLFELEKAKVEGLLNTITEFKEERDKSLKDYESRFQDNVLYEIEASLKPLAMSRLPDLIVTPGNDSEQSRLMAQEISKAVDTDISIMFQSKWEQAEKDMTAVRSLAVRNEMNLLQEVRWLRDKLDKRATKEEHD